jgi:hypothetical protein
MLLHLTINPGMKTQGFQAKLEYVGGEGGSRNLWEFPDTLSKLEKV